VPIHYPITNRIVYIIPLFDTLLSVLCIWLEKRETLVLAMYYYTLTMKHWKTTNVEDQCNVGENHCRFLFPLYITLHLERKTTQYF